ncbi:MAG: TetR family transcriptional regulator [Pseudomonadota bacterium]
MNLVPLLSWCDMPKGSKTTTKVRLLNAAISEFAAHGFKGASLRDIAKGADANVAAVKYHYKSKDDLWREVVSHLYRALGEAVMQDKRREQMGSVQEAIRHSTRQYILFSAKNPELYRITLFEMIEGGERLDWLARNQLREFMERSMAWSSIAQQGGVFDKKVPPLNLVYVMMGAIQTLFMMAPQIERSFGIDVFVEEQVDAHVDAIMRLFDL